ncbi:AAA family ATPase [Cryptosporangium sp. NPDC051539]|uniref:AAA family ATPase n=1 Tax=Cryptosporangium sp. NPDC051539 TaxID=3363962 RepID=UPI0037AD37B7
MSTAPEYDEFDEHGPDMPPALRVVAEDGDVAARREAPRLRTWTAQKLMATQFTAPLWAVPGILPEGVSLVTGPPKVGKSWLSLDLGLTIAEGGKALGSIDVDPGPVLYLALEDTERRLQSRIGRILAGRIASSDLELTTECPPLPQGGDRAIARWIEEHPGTRMVIIDVFAKVRGQSAAGTSAYDADYAAVGRAKRLADRYGIAVVLVHHVRKQASDDFLAEVSGTNGIAGAADTILVLKRPRGQADGVLHVTGRDVDEAEYAMAFQPATGQWHLLDGPAEDYELGDTRATILRHLRANPGQGPTAIARATGLNLDNVKQTVGRMRDAGQLIADNSGRYSLPTTPGEEQ